MPHGSKSIWMFTKITLLKKVECYKIIIFIY